MLIRFTFVYILIFGFSGIALGNNSDDFYGYVPKNNQKLERNPWGFHEFWWKGPTEKGPYTLQVAKDIEFKDLIYFQTVNRYHDFTRHLPDQATVYWRVLYKDKMTPTYKVDLIPGSEYKVQIEKAVVVPFDIANKQAGSIELKWQEKTRKGPYDLEVSPDSDFKSLVFRKRTRQLSYKIKKFAEAGQFYWRVKFGKFISPVGRFRINQSMVNAAKQLTGPYIALKEPLDGEAIDIEDGNIRFQWQDITPGTEYRLEVSSTGDFGNIVIDQTTSNNFLEVSNLAKQGTYFWRVSSPRFESPVSSFILAPVGNVFEQSFSLFKTIFWETKPKHYFAFSEFQFSSLKGNDLDNSTSGNLVSNTYAIMGFGMQKQLYPTWNFQWHLDYTLIDRQPPVSYQIRNPVSGLIGAQAGVYNKVLKDLQAGLFIRYSEFELIKTITGSIFEMDKEAALSVGGRGEYRLFRWWRTESIVGAEFYASLPFVSNLGSALVSKFFWDFKFNLFGTTKSRLGIYYQNTGVVSDDASQSAEATGLNFRIDFE